MNVIKGFALNRTLVDNTPGVVADVGELSALGYTSAKEPRVYSSPTFPTISLVHFPTIGSGVGYSAEIPDDQRDFILNVINLIYQQSQSGTIAISPGQFVQNLQNQLGANIANISVGAQVTYGTWTIVEWVQFNNPAVDDTNVNKIWFSNASFIGQYDEYDFTVVPPFLPVDQFFGQPADVKALLTGTSYQQRMQDIDTARNQCSETVLWGKEFNYVNPVNTADLTPAPFTVLIYGEAGNNIDLIKEAIVNYLLANSSYTRDQWKNILPDLFLRTEFLMFPQYDAMAIANVVGGNNGVYSPVVDMNDVITQMQTDSYQYDPTFVQTNAQIMPFPWMSVAIGTIGNAENRDSKVKITDWYPDYFFVATTSTDFNRMSLDTQGWVKLIEQMLPMARDLTTASTVEIGFSRVQRGNKLYISKSYDDVQFLIAAPGTVSS